MDEPLRQSTIYSYLRCPYQHHLRTTDPTSQAFRHPAAVFGTTIHGLIARLHAGEWEMDLESAFLEAFEKEVSTDSHQPQERIEDLNGHWATARQNDSPILPVWWKDEVAERETYRADGVAILEGYRNKDYNRNAKILLAEASFAVKVGRQTINGTLDQLRQHRDGSLELVDFKTSKAAPPQSYVDLDYQLALYAYALKHGTFLIKGQLIRPNVLPDKLTLYFLRHHIPYKRATGGKLAGEERGDPRISTTRSAEQLRALKQDVSAVARMIKLGLHPRSPDPMKCGVCSFADACRGATRDTAMPTAKLNDLLTQLENIA